MSRITRVLRTPAHFGNTSFSEEVAIQNIGESRSYDRDLTKVFQKLHLAQGTSFSDVDLFTRIPVLARHAEPMDKREFASTLFATLFGEIFPNVFGTDPETVNISVALRQNPQTALNCAFLKEIHRSVNERFNTHLALWQSQVKANIAADTAVALKVKQSLSLENALEKLRKAELSGKNTESAEASVAKAKADLDDVEALRFVAAELRAQFAVTVLEMRSIRNLETVTRSFKLLAEANTESAEELSKTLVLENAHTLDENVELALQALHAVVSTYPELFLDAVDFADSLLSPDERN